MSGGRNKLGDFGQLKSLVSSSFKGLKDKTDRFRNKAQDTETKNASQKSHGAKSTSRHQGQKNQQGAGGRVQTRMEKASTQKHFHMPQYGQKVDYADDFSQENQPQEAELVITVDANKQVQMDERRLFGWLCKRFPKCFNPRAKKPLKIGISEEIEVIFKAENQSDVDQMALRRTLRRYVGDQNYQRSILEHKARYDLKGNVAEEMTDEHVAHAEERLAELKEKAAFRKQGGTNLEYYEMKKKEKEALEKVRVEEANAEKKGDEISVEDTEAQADVAEIKPEASSVDEPVLEESMIEAPIVEAEVVETIKEETSEKSEAIVENEKTADIEAATQASKVEEEKPKEGE